MRARAQSIRIAVAAAAVTWLAGCESDAGPADLREFVANAHAGRAPRVESLPEVRTQEPFAYAAAELVDPFSPSSLRPQATAATTGGPRPDLNRRKEPLEEYPLDTLKMVGTLERGDNAWVIIQAPDRTVYRVGVGNYIGQNFGEIRRIDEDKIQIVELIQGAVGNWIEREASIALAER